MSYADDVRGLARRAERAALIYRAAAWPHTILTGPRVESVSFHAGRGKDWDTEPSLSVWFAVAHEDEYAAPIRVEVPIAWPDWTDDAIREHGDLVRRRREDHEATAKFEHGIRDAIAHVSSVLGQDHALVAQLRELHQQGWAALRAAKEGSL